MRFSWLIYFPGNYWEDICFQKNTDVGKKYVVCCLYYNCKQFFLPITKALNLIAEAEVSGWSWSFNVYKQNILVSLIWDQYSSFYVFLN